MVGIYKITSPTNKIYIGQSTNIELRKKFYIKCSCNNQTKLYNSIKKYGWDSHTFEVIAECHKEQLNDLEKYYISKYNALGVNGLNLRDGGNNGRMSDETKLKMSKSKTGKSNNMYGKRHTKETKEKISKIHKGRKLSESHIEKIRKNSTGRIASDEMKRKVSLSKLGKPRPQSLKDKLRFIKSKPFAISNNSFYMEFESVTKAADFLKCSRKEISNKKKYKEYNLMYL